MALPAERELDHALRGRIAQRKARADLATAHCSRENARPPEKNTQPLRFLVFFSKCRQCFALAHGAL